MDLDEGGRWSEDRGQKADRRDHGAAAGNPQFSDNPQSAIRNPQLSDNPQSAIRNPQFLPPLIFLEVSADGFLYNMVRAIAGTLINVGRGYWPVAAVQQILHARDRTQAGPTAPPHGLFLVCVDY
jgi:tRNA pseudouridine38-40 synthase